MITTSRKRPIGGLFMPFLHRTFGGSSPSLGRVSEPNTMGGMQLVTVDDVRSAARRLAGRVVRTPLLSCPWSDPGRPLWLKPENLQPVGAFKVRGAVHAISRLPEGVRSRGVVAYS